MRQAEGIILNPLERPRHSGESRNPEGPFAREKTIEGWRRAWRVEMIEKGNWRWPGLYEGIVWLDSGFRRNDGRSPSSTLSIPNEPLNEGLKLMASNRRRSLQGDVRKVFEP